MSKQRLTSEELDAWHSERNLDRIRAPARHAVTAWTLVAAIALAAILGPPATRQTVAGLDRLRHDVLMLDRVSLRSRLAFRGAFPVSPAVIAAFERDQT